MKVLGSALASFVSIAGFLAVFAGILSFSLDAQRVFAQRPSPEMGPPQAHCFSCQCLYPNSGWCDVVGSQCDWPTDGCGCTPFGGCSFGAAPTSPYPY